MDALARLLFPRNPRMVRHRKLQIVFITILICLLVCGSITLLVFLLSKFGG